MSDLIRVEDALIKIAGDKVPSSTIGQLSDGLFGGASRRVKRAIQPKSTVSNIKTYGNRTDGLISKYENM